MACKLALACRPQLCGAVFDHFAIHRRHPRGGRAFARGVREDMQPREVAVFYERQRVRKHRVAFCGEACDDVGPIGHVRAQFAGIFGKADRIIAQVAPLHPFEDHVVAML